MYIFTTLKSHFLQRIAVNMPLNLEIQKRNVTLDHKTSLKCQILKLR